MNQKELATFLNLSQTTVSRALAGYADVSEETKRLVLKTALEHGYRPNSSARRLVTGKAGSIGVVFPMERNLIVDPHFLEVLAGLSEALGEVGTDILLTPTIAAREIDTYDRLAREGAVDGIIIVGTKVEDERVEHLAKLDFPFVTHGRTKRGSEHAYLDIDNEGGFRRATELLLDLGHQKVGLINGQPDRNYADDRLIGYRKALEGRHLNFEPSLVVAAPMTVEKGYQAARAFLTQTVKPTAIVCGSTVVAIGVMQALRENGLDIGKDISIVAHDDGLSTVRADLSSLPLTTTFSPVQAAGKRIAQMLLERIGGEAVTALQEIWPVDLIVRTSTGKV